MTAIPLGRGPEFDRIRAIAQVLGDAAVGLGDDCAFLDGGWCASTDASVEGVHFRRAWLTPAEIGWRAAMASLSDLAAVGARAEAVLVALSARREEPVAVLTEVMAGVGEAATAVGARVVGGDLTGGSALALTVTVLGRAERPIRRQGARPGDELWVTGTLGGARAAWQAWEGGSTPAPEARVRFARPLARIREGQWLAVHGATAMLDLSDGLGGDAWHLARASSVGLDIDLERLPIDPAVADRDRAVAAATGGEDYELLVAMPTSPNDELAGRMKDACGTPLTRIGRVVSGDGARFFRDGQELALAGFDHFR